MDGDVNGYSDRIFQCKCESTAFVLQSNGRVRCDICGGMFDDIVVYFLAPPEGSTLEDSAVCSGSA